MHPRTAQAGAFFCTDTEQLLDKPFLAFDERAAINAGRWFASLSAPLRHDILRSAYVRRFKDSEIICARGDPARVWAAVARGAVRVGGSPHAGKPVTLTYVEPGAWIGDIGIFGGGIRTHDAYAHGDTTLLQVSHDDLLRILEVHVELYGALLRLNAGRLRHMFRQIEDLNTLPLRARLATKLKSLMRSYGMPLRPDSGEIRIGLSLAQQDLAGLLGASRQRVNRELKLMEREETIRVNQGSLVVRCPETLSRIARRA